VTAIYEDRQGTLWIGTVGGLNMLVLSKVEGVDRSSGTPPAEQERFIRFQHDPDTAQKMRHSLSDNEVLSILEDSAGNLWVGTVNGLDQLILGEGPVLSEAEGPVLSEAEGPVLSEAEGLDRSEDRFLHFRHDPNDPFSLSDDVVLSLYEDRSGVLWIATANGVSKYVFPKQFGKAVPAID